MTVFNNYWLRGLVGAALKKNYALYRVNNESFSNVKNCAFFLYPLQHDLADISGQFAPEWVAGSAGISSNPGNSDRRIPEKGRYQEFMHLQGRI